MTFLRPKPGQSPTTATFEVPLTFNKLDFRDYLYHLYNVETTSVRSFINQRMPTQRSVTGAPGGQWYRPRAQKLMIVDLVKPFTWPERPREEDMGEWDHKLFVAVEKGHDEDVKKAVAKISWGPQRMRTDEKVPRDRRELHKLAVELLTGKKTWAPGLEKLGEVTEEEKRAKAAKLNKDRAALAAAAAGVGKDADIVTLFAKESARGSPEDVVEEKRP